LNQWSGYGTGWQNVDELPLPIAIVSEKMLMADRADTKRALSMVLLPSYAREQGIRHVR
jgi:hypothetical protein